MTTLNEWYDKGTTIEAYIDAMTTNKENLQKIYEGFEFPSDNAFFDELRRKELRVIVLTEDWCGDAMMNVPILSKLADKAGIRASVLLRDSNLELMDQYLTNGTARAIPIFVFIDKEGKEQAVWGPRAPEVQAFVTELRADLPAKDDPTFEEKQQAVHEKIVDTYVNNTDMWSYVYASLKSKLQG
ncbi:thioredoxin family protein [Niallia sp. 01092]|uniref:thioredoxin family protein n=1 Tax=unclassified Niallia TaxID=2837522 RepID=UPI003FD0C379